MEAPVLEVRDLKIRLPPEGDRAHAVDGVSFGVQRGEIVCLVGNPARQVGDRVFGDGLLAKTLRIESAR